MNGSHNQLYGHRTIHHENWPFDPTLPHLPRFLIYARPIFPHLAHSRWPFQIIYLSKYIYVPVQMHLQGSINHSGYLRMHCEYSVRQHFWWGNSCLLSWVEIHLTLSPSCFLDLHFLGVLFLSLQLGTEWVETVRAASTDFPPWAFLEMGRVLVEISERQS